MFQAYCVEHISVVNQCLIPMVGGSFPERGEYELAFQF